MPATRPRSNLAKRRRRLSLEQLEARQLLSGVQPSVNEQVFLERLNDARANPAAYGASIGLDLSGVAPAQPLAFDPTLIQVDRQHSQDMNDRAYFAHNTPEGVDPGQRLTNAGVAWTSWGESIAAGYANPDDALKGLIVDTGIADLGHRRHLLAMDDLFKNQEQAGVGIAQGGGPYGTYYSIDTVATGNSQPFVTGVVFADLNGNGRYDAGEGLGGVTVSVAGGSSTTTFDTGGYSLGVAPGAYTVTASGGGLAAPLTQNVSVGASNARLNFVPPSAGGTSFRSSQVPAAPSPASAPAPAPSAPSNPGGSDAPAPMAPWQFGPNIFNVQRTKRRRRPSRNHRAAARARVLAARGTQAPRKVLSDAETTVGSAALSSDLGSPGMIAVEPGHRWASNQISFSFMPDGTPLGNGTSNLFATWDAQFGAGVWEQQIVRALNTYASDANLSFTQVADSGLPEDTAGLSQGDSRFGDIRFGGTNEQDPVLLGLGNYPPPNGSTAAGDVIFNDANNFHIGSDYDLYSVALHEVGHALGLAHTTDPTAAMFAKYTTVLNGLGSGDVASIQSLYGAPGASNPVPAAAGPPAGFANPISSTALPPVPLNPQLPTFNFPNLGVTSRRRPQRGRPFGAPRHQHRSGHGRSATRAALTLDTLSDREWLGLQG